jgi:hypothetical protein
VNSLRKVVFYSLLVSITILSCQSINPYADLTFEFNGFLYNRETSFPEELDIKLVYAVMNGRLNEAKELIENGADVNAEGKNEASPLLFSILAKNYDGFRFLLNNGANPNTQHDILFTPLYLVSGLSDIRFLRTILDAGANPNLPIQFDNRPLLEKVAQNIQWDRLELIMRKSPKNEIYDTIILNVLFSCVSLTRYIRAFNILTNYERDLLDSRELDILISSINSHLERPDFFESKKPYLMNLVSYLVFEKEIDSERFNVPNELQALIQNDWD